MQSTSTTNSKNRRGSSPPFQEPEEIFDEWVKELRCIHQTEDIPSMTQSIGNQEYLQVDIAPQSEVSTIAGLSENTERTEITETPESGNVTQPTNELL